MSQTKMTKMKLREPGATGKVGPMRCKYCDHPVYPPDEDGRDNHVQCEMQGVEDRWSDEIDRRLESTPATG